VDNKDIILIIDDDKSLQFSLKLYLEEKNFLVKTVNNALEGFEFLNQEVPSVILLDIIMPQISGYKFLEFVRNTPRFSCIPIVMLTAKGLTADRIRGYSLGCNAYLSKPFNSEELLSIIHNVLIHYKNYLLQITSPKLIIDNRSMMHSSFSHVGVPFNSNEYELALSPREQNTLNLVAKGYMNKEIARELRISIRHVERYVTRLFKEFRVSNRTELVRVALQYLFITE